MSGITYTFAGVDAGKLGQTLDNLRNNSSQFRALESQIAANYDNVVVVMGPGVVPRHKSIPLGDLEWLVMPPVGVAVWALVDDFVARRIDAGDKRLTAVEWKSGTNMRILDIVAPFGAEAEMREQVAAL